MQTLIEIDLQTLDPKLRGFIEMELSKCTQRGVPVELACSNNVISKGFPCAGYFDDEPLGFAVAAKGSPRTWLPTFVHESCHLDQWLERSQIWFRRIDGKIPSDLFDQWLRHEVEYSSDEIREVIDAIVAIELDCEVRSTEKIRQHGLPIKIDTYIRKSNAYVWSYRLMQETRNWDHSGAYDHPMVWRSMQKEFHADYKELPAAIRRVFMDQIAVLKR